MKKKKQQQKINEIEQHNQVLAKKGLILREMESDGNCLFRSVADQLYGDQQYHSEIRNYVMQYLQIEKQYFINFIAEMEENSKKDKKKSRKQKKREEKKQKGKNQSEQIEKQEVIEPKNDLDLIFDNYVKEMSENGAWGDNIEIQIISEIYQRSIEIYVAFQETPMRTFHESQDQFKVNEPIRLSYHGQSHYNSIKSLNHEKLIQEKVGIVEEISLQKARNREKQHINISINQNLNDPEYEFYNMCRSQFQLYDNEEMYNKYIQEQSSNLTNDQEILQSEGKQLGLMYQSEQLYNQGDPQNQDLALQIAIEESKYLMEQLKIKQNDSQSIKEDQDNQQDQQKQQNLNDQIPDNKNQINQFQSNNLQQDNAEFEKIIVINSVVNAGFSREQAEEAIYIVGLNEDLIVNYILEQMM